MLFQLTVLDQNVCMFLSFSSIQLKVFSLSYYQLLQPYILLTQQDQFLAFVCQLAQLQYDILLIHLEGGISNLKFQLDCVLPGYLLCTVLWPVFIINCCLLMEVKMKILPVLKKTSHATLDLNY